SQPRLLPIGGGPAPVEGLAGEAAKLGANFGYETTPASLMGDDRGAIARVRAVGPDASPLEFRARSVVLGCGGFEGNPEMLTRYMGPRAIHLRPICRGGHYNKGEGIRMALEIG